MLRSPGLRFIIVGLLVLLMTIPVFFVGAIIDSRADYNRQTIASVGQEWGGQQLLSGPVLIIPVEETVMVREREEVIDPLTGEQKLDGDDQPVFRFREVERVLRRVPVYVYPDLLDLKMDKTTQERSRGIFSVPVYTAKAEGAFDFNAEEAEAALRGEEVLLWDEAEVRVYVSSNRALRGETRLMADGRALEMEPVASENRYVGGLRAPTGDPRQIGAFDLKMGLNGAEALSFTPVGRETRVTLTSDWPHPEFQGAFLPDSHEVRDDGFQANWVIPHLARPLPQVSREDQNEAARSQSSFGVGLYQPNDFYQKAYRAARYGILFIGLTFLTIFLVEGQTKRPTHPVQYILIGLAQSAFFLLMLALSEQVGFGMAYLVSGAATVGLVTAFAARALKLGKRTLVVGAMLTVLYGVLYLILRSADYALLAGSILLFAAIAGTMFATRNENWYGEPRTGPRRGWFRKAEPQPEAPQPAS